MENALCSIVKAIVDEPEDISLNIIESEYVLMYELSVGWVWNRCPMHANDLLICKRSVHSHTK